MENSIPEGKAEDLLQVTSIKPFENIALAFSGGGFRAASFASDIYRKQNPPPTPFLNPSRDIQIVAQTAYDMGTTLWFDKDSVTQKHSQACIIACGQFTTCYNLLGYIEKLLRTPSPYDSIYQNRVLSLKRQLEADYARFKTDPFFVYNDYGRQWIDKFVPVTMKDIPDPGD